MHVAFVCLNAADLFTRAGRAAGGTERQMVLVGRALARRGHRVTFVVRDAEGMDGGGIRLAPVRPRHGLPPGVGRLSDLLRMLRAVGRPRPDCLVEQGAGRSALDAALLARAWSRPFLFRGAHDDDFRMELIHRDSRVRLQQRLAVRMADAVIAQTDRQRELARECFGVEARVIPDAIEIPEPPPPPGDEVLWVGMLRPEKRPERVLALARALPRARFTVVGGAPAPGLPGAEAAQAFLREAATLPNVSCAGYQPPDAVAPFFARAAVVINTSAGEGFPNVFLEAWARGRPVVTCGIDPDEVICRHGLGVHARDLDEMARALGALMDDPARRGEWGANARRYVGTHHAIGPVVDQYEALFREVTDR